MEHAGVGVLDGGRYVFVPDGLIFASSNEGGGGLWILEYRPGVTGIVVWIADKKNVTVKYAEK
jgi:hypothetical protein